MGAVTIRDVRKLYDKTEVLKGIFGRHSGRRVPGAGRTFRLR